MHLTLGSFTRDIFLIPTIRFHNEDGLYYALELNWLKWYIGVFAYSKKMKED